MNKGRVHGGFPPLCGCSDGRWFYVAVLDAHFVIDEFRHYVLHLLFAAAFFADERLLLLVPHHRAAAIRGVDLRELEHYSPHEGRGLFRSKGTGLFLVTA